ncbi:hypothetical protein BJ166DRAFT_364684 [Pestalotiopsis sp. NC0098]|nr:hypothetical protein BJ166DRAFT_364684 [Pestalotiopsis sp. NC0098]
MDPHRGRSGFPGSYPHSFESGSRPESTSRHSYHGSPSDALDVPSKRKRSVERNTVSELDHRESRATKRTRPSGNLKFACPYFKRDPTRYTRRQACSGPGFTSISRLKEHIYRGHRQPEYQCIRCYSIFGNKDLLEDHQRALVPCEISSSRSSDGISEAQYTRLRRKASGAKSDAERWEDVYRILFPTAPSIPSCYYETHDTMAISRLDRAGLEHMENTVMAGLERDLEDRLDQVGADIKASIFSMVKERLGHTINTLQATKNRSPIAS